MTIRFATPADTAAVLDIYAPYITQSAISFEYDVPSVAEFAERIRLIQQQFPFLVAEQDGRLLGYAYGSRHAERIAYQWSVNTSVYVHPDGQRQGIARRLYTTLFAYLRHQGYYTAFAGITLPNLKSESFHQTMGFQRIGTYANTGYKFGEWHSVAWLQLALQPYSSSPVPPIPITQLIASGIDLPTE